MRLNYLTFNACFLNLQNCHTAVTHVSRDRFSSTAISTEKVLYLVSQAKSYKVKYDFLDDRFLKPRIIKILTTTQYFSLEMTSSSDVILRIRSNEFNKSGNGTSSGLLETSEYLISVAYTVYFVINLLSICKDGHHGQRLLQYEQTSRHSNQVSSSGDTRTPEA